MSFLLTVHRNDFALVAADDRVSVHQLEGVTWKTTRADRCEKIHPLHGGWISCGGPTDWHPLVIEALQGADPADDHSIIECLQPIVTRVDAECPRMPEVLADAVRRGGLAWWVFPIEGQLRSRVLHWAQGEILERDPPVAVMPPWDRAPALGPLIAELDRAEDLAAVRVAVARIFGEVRERWGADGPVGPRVSVGLLERLNGHLRASRAGSSQPVGVADISRPVIDFAEKASTGYTVTFHVTARVPYGQQVKISHRTTPVASPINNYTDGSPTSTSLNTEPFSTDITVDRSPASPGDRWFEVWAEDSDGNRSFIARELVKAIADPESALDTFTATHAFPNSPPCQAPPSAQKLQDTLTWNRGAGVPAGWAVRLSWCTGTSCSLPGTTLQDPATSGYVNVVTTGVQNGSGGIGSPAVRSYRIQIFNAYGEVVDFDDIVNKSTSYADC